MTKKEHFKLINESIRRHNNLELLAILNNKPISTMVKALDPSFNDNESISEYFIRKTKKDMNKNYEDPEKRLEFENRAIEIKTQDLQNNLAKEIEELAFKETFCAKHHREMEERKSIAEEAIKIVKGHRNNDYGSAVDSFERISKMASLMTNKELTPLDCVRVLKAVKLVRESYKHKEDNLIDLIGYTEIENQIINNGSKD